MLIVLEESLDRLLALLLNLPALNQKRFQQNISVLALRILLQPFQRLLAKRHLTEICSL